MPTFEQVVKQPVQLLDKPERIISVSKPDPNIFDFHAGQMQDQQHFAGMAGKARTCDLASETDRAGVTGFAHPENRARYPVRTMNRKT